VSSTSATVRRSKLRWALGLWLVLAAIVFMVRFDWQTREAAHQFAAEQLARHERGLATTTINDGFRPRVRAEARRAALWSGLILVTGVGGTAWASRSQAPRSQRAPV
jgi:hypothetical protein